MLADEPSQLSKRRKLLDNPYAHIEQLLEFEQSVSSDIVHSSRRSLQNQYAHLEYLEEQNSTIQHSQFTPISFERIEAIVTQLQRQLWRDRSKYWPDRTNIRPIEVLDSAFAANMIGFRINEVDTLGFYTDRTERVTVAGLIDRPKKMITISRELLPASRNFTTAHELGHAVLHTQLSTVHRDRPTDGSRISRDRIEIEADKFATYFLLPRKLVKSAFLDRYLTKTFVLFEDTAFALFQKTVARGRIKNLLDSSSFSDIGISNQLQWYPLFFIG